MASIIAYTKARIDALLALKVTTPSGGSDGQALVKSGTAAVWATITGSGSATTDASALTTGTLAPARIGDASIAVAKLAFDPATQSELDTAVAALPAKSSVAGVVTHDGTTGGGTRPSGFAYVIWRGGSSRPTNMATGDIWEHDA